MPKTGLYDIHCHIIPEVDDGARSMEESMKMLEMEYSEGVRHILLTPHFRYEMFETPLETLRDQYAALKTAAAGRWPDLELKLGCELHTSLDLPLCLDQGTRLSMNGTEYVLLEFSGRDPRSQIFERTRDLLNHGYIPVIAHIERYAVLRNDISHLRELKDMGAFLQVNADTISGKDGFMAKRYARKLMKAELIDFVGTDAHRMDTRTPGLLAAYETAARSIGPDYADWLFIYHPSVLFKTDNSEMRGKH